MKFKSENIGHQPKSFYLGKPTENKKKNIIEETPIYNWGTFTLDVNGNIILSI